MANVTFCQNQATALRCGFFSANKPDWLQNVNIVALILLNWMKVSIFAKRFDFGFI